MPVSPKHFIVPILLSIPACAYQVDLQATYRPIIKRNLDANVKLGDFLYAPSNNAGLFELSGPSLHSYRLATPISIYVRDAFASELKNSSVQIIEESRCSISAVISQLGPRDVGFSVTYYSDIAYVLNVNGNEVFSENTLNTYSTSKGTPVDQAVNEILYMDFKELFDNPSFIHELSSRCG